MVVLLQVHSTLPPLVPSPVRSNESPLIAGLALGPKVAEMTSLTTETPET